MLTSFYIYKSNYSSNTIGGQLIEDDTAKSPNVSWVNLRRWMFGCRNWRYNWWNEGQLDNISQCKKRSSSSSIPCLLVVYWVVMAPGGRKSSLLQVWCIWPPPLGRDSPLFLSLSPSSFTSSSVLLSLSASRFSIFSTTLFLSALSLQYLACPLCLCHLHSHHLKLVLKKFLLQFNPSY